MRSVPEKPNQERKLLEERNRTIMSGYAELRKNYEEMAVFRHDMKNHMILLENCILKGEKEKAEDYIEELMKKLKGKAVSISQTSITNLENGKGMVSIPILFEILRYLDVGVEVIFREYSHVANRTMVDLSELESLLSKYPEEQRSTMIRSLASFIRAAKLS